MSLAKIEQYLESNGWTRQVAGDADFGAALLAAGCPTPSIRSN